MLLKILFSHLKLSIEREDIDKKNYDTCVENLTKLPEAIKKTLKLESEIQLIAKEFLDAKGSMLISCLR